MVGGAGRGGGERGRHLEFGELVKYVNKTYNYLGSRLMSGGLGRMLGGWVRDAVSISLW